MRGGSGAWLLEGIDERHWARELHRLRFGELPEKRTPVVQTNGNGPWNPAKAGEQRLDAAAD